MYRFAVLVLLYLFPACATITTGTDQSITILTDPAGADCQLTRDGMAIAIANPTPQTVRIDKSVKAIQVVCRKDGFHPVHQNLASVFQGMTIGNILFGGIIGVVVDAGSGAMHQYSESIEILLVPTRFASAQERDAFFETAQTKVKTKVAAAVSKVRETCSAEGSEGCDSKVKAVEKQGEAEMLRLDSYRSQAQIGG